MWLRSGARRRDAAWACAFMLIWAVLGYAAGLYPPWDIPLAIIGGIIGVAFWFALLNTIRLIRKRGSK